MANFITEDMIEQAILKKLGEPEFGYDIVICDASPDKKEDLNDGTGRSEKTECILPCVLEESLCRINPNIPSDKIKSVIKTLTADFSDSDLVSKNYELYNKIRNFIKIPIIKNGKEDFDFIKLIDFDKPKNNTFSAVSQMWIKGRYNWRRPDVIIFINGLPLVFIELKNGIVKVEEAYQKNLKSYIKDIPNLFAFNQICVLSNGFETRLGAFNATFDYFFEWLKQKEGEKIDRKSISENGVSAEYFVDGLLHKETLIDYIENFILFENKSIKIIAKNHQFLGVNNLMQSVHNRKELNGKLGVFWHTQGSGKSYSMVMFARKVRRKVEGNFSFLVITDRDDLDTQIYKNFVRTEVVGNKEECQPKNGQQLREYLQTNKSFIFTLIHKFRYDKTKKYPVLSTRDDIIVMVDEAHRTQYKDLAENMRTALPNANFIAFTGLCSEQSALQINGSAIMYQNTTLHSRLKMVQQFHCSILAECQKLVCKTIFLMMTLLISSKMKTLMRQKLDFLRILLLVFQKLLNVKTVLIKLPVISLIISHAEDSSVKEWLFPLISLQL